MLALAGLTRTEAVPLAVCLWLVCGGLALARRLSPAAVLAGVLCWSLPLGLWAWRNHRVSGAWTLDLHGGITLLDGIVYFDLNEMDTAYARQALEKSELYRKAEGLSELERDRLFRGAALRWMREHPREVVRQWAHKAFNFWRLYPRLDKEYPETATAGPALGASRRLLAAVSVLVEGPLLALGAAGAWLLRRRLAALFPLYGAVAGTFLIHMVVISQMRYRLPVMPAVIVFAAAALHRGLERGGFREGTA